jgi:hypothetical protein
MSVVANNLLSLKDRPQAVKPKVKTAQEVEAELFVNKRFGTFSLLFTVKDDTVKAHKSDGYLALKPRGQGRITRHFVIASDAPLPPEKDLIKMIEAHYGHSADYKLAQLHCKPLPR